MALLGIENLTAEIRLGLWKIEDRVEDIVAADRRIAPLVDFVEASYRSMSRRKEVLAVYALLFAMTGDSSLRISHDTLSCPKLEGYNISISHTHGYAALILSTRDSVAVDIEYYSDRVKHVVPKFIRSDEYAADINSMLVHWCAKETMFKLLHEENLDMLEIRLHPFTVTSEGEVAADDLKKEKIQKIYYRFNEDFVLTYAYL